MTPPQESGTPVFVPQARVPQARAIVTARHSCGHVSSACVLVQTLGETKQAIETQPCYACRTPTNATMKTALTDDRQPSWRLAE